MKKFKKIFLIIAVVCFFVLFVSPRPSSAFAEGGETISTAYDITQQYFTYMQANQQAILSQFYTYAYVSVVYRNVTYNYCCNVTNIQSFENRTVYTCGSGTCYYAGSALPVFSNQTITVYPDFIRASGNDFYYDSSQHPNYVIYCDLPSESYSNPNDGSSLHSHTLNVVPPVSFGYISHQSGDYDDNIQDTLDRWQPPEPATLPPFNPPETLPPETLLPDVLTIYPPNTDINGSYYVDYQPYIHGDFFPITADNHNTDILISSGSLISYSWDFLTSYEDFKSIVLLLLILSLILNLLT